MKAETSEKNKKRQWSKLGYVYNFESHSEKLQKYFYEIFHAPRYFPSILIYWSQTENPF